VDTTFSAVAVTNPVVTPSQPTQPWGGNTQSSAKGMLVESGNNTSDAGTQSSRPWGANKDTSTKGYAQPDNTTNTLYKTGNTGTVSSKLKNGSNASGTTSANGSVISGSDSLNPGGNISNDQLVQVAQNDAQQDAEAAQSAKDEATKATEYASDKLLEAQNLNNEATEIINNTSGVTNAKQKNDSLAKASSLRQQANEISKKAIEAFQVAAQEQADAKTKQRQADLAKQYSSSLDSATKVKDKKQAIANLIVQQDNLKKQQQAIPSTAPVTAGDLIREQAQNTKQDSSQVAQHVEELKQEINGLQQQSEDYISKAQKTDNAQEKVALLEQAKDLSESKKNKQNEIADNQKLEVQLHGQYIAQTNEARSADSISKSNPEETSQQVSASDAASIKQEIASYTPPANDAAIATSLAKINAANQQATASNGNTGTNSQTGFNSQTSPFNVSNPNVAGSEVAANTVNSNTGSQMSQTNGSTDQNNAANSTQTTSTGNPTNSLTNLSQNNTQVSQTNSGSASNAILATQPSGNSLTGSVNAGNNQSITNISTNLQTAQNSSISNANPTGNTTANSNSVNSSGSQSNSQFGSSNTLGTNGSQTTQNNSTSNNPTNAGIASFANNPDNSANAAQTGNAIGSTSQNATTNNPANSANTQTTQQNGTLLSGSQTASSSSAGDTSHQGGTTAQTNANVQVQDNTTGNVITPQGLVTYSDPNATQANRFAASYNSASDSISVQANIIREKVSRAKDEDQARELSKEADSLDNMAQQQKIQGENAANAAGSSQFLYNKHQIVAWQNVLYNSHATSDELTTARLLLNDANLYYTKSLAEKQKADSTDKGYLKQTYLDNATNYINTALVKQQSAERVYLNYNPKLASVRPSKSLISIEDQQNQKTSNALALQQDNNANTQTEQNNNNQVSTPQANSASTANQISQNSITNLTINSTSPTTNSTTAGNQSAQNNTATNNQGNSTQVVTTNNSVTIPAESTTLLTGTNPATNNQSTSANSSGTNQNTNTRSTQNSATITASNSTSQSTVSSINSAGTSQTNNTQLASQNNPANSTNLNSASNGQSAINNTAGNINSNSTGSSTSSANSNQALAQNNSSNVNINPIIATSSGNNPTDNTASIQSAKKIDSMLSAGSTATNLNSNTIAQNNASNTSNTTSPNSNSNSSQINSATNSSSQTTNIGSNNATVQTGTSAQSANKIDSILSTSNNGSATNTIGASNNPVNGSNTSTTNTSSITSNNTTSNIDNTAQSNNAVATNNKGTSESASTTENSSSNNRRSVTIAVTEDVFTETKASPYSAKKPIPINVPLPEGLVFKVQIGAFRNAIRQNLFKGIQPITGEKTAAGLTRYVAGVFKDVKGAQNAQGKIKDLGFKDAFVVAFYNGKRISLSEAEAVLSGTPPAVVASANIPQSNSVTTTDNANQVITTPQQEPQTGTVASTPVSNLKGLFYSVQVGAYQHPVSAAKLYNLSPLFSYNAPNGYIRYNCGIYSNISMASIAKHEIVSKTPIQDAFIVAYQNGERIPLAQAAQLISAGATAPQDANLNVMPRSSAAGNNNNNTPIQRAQPSAQPVQNNNSTPVVNTPAPIITPAVQPTTTDITPTNTNNIPAAPTTTIPTPVTTPTVQPTQTDITPANTNTTAAPTTPTPITTPTAQPTSTDITPANTTVLPTPVNNANSAPTSPSMATRSFSVSSTDPTNDVTVSVTIHRGTISGFAKLEETVPTGFTASSGDGKGATFKFKDGKVGYVWLSLPTDSIFTVTYHVTALSTTSGAQTFNGRFMYTENNERQASPIPSTILTVNGAGTTTTTTLPTQSQDTSNQKVTFCVQVGTFSGPIPIDMANKLLQISNQGIKAHKEDNGATSYTIGEYNNYTSANLLKEELVKDGYTNSFIVAYANGNKISLQQAQLLMNK